LKKFLLLRIVDSLSSTTTSNVSYNLSSIQGWRTVKGFKSTSRYSRHHRNKSTQRLVQVSYIWKARNGKIEYSWLFSTASDFL
jgi:hypothetical protein